MIKKSKVYLNIVDTTAYYKEFKKIKLTPFKYGIKKTIEWNKKYE
jgi:hypothetical protein